jgi:hypothetical protein
MPAVPPPHPELGDLSPYLTSNVDFWVLMAVKDYISDRRLDVNTDLASCDATWWASTMMREAEFDQRAISSIANIFSYVHWLVSHDYPPALRLV